VLRILPSSGRLAGRRVYPTAPSRNHRMVIIQGGPAGRSNFSWTAESRHVSRSNTGANRSTCHRLHDRRRDPFDPRHRGSASPGNDRHGWGRDARAGHGRRRLQLSRRAAAPVAWKRGRRGMRLRARVPNPRHVSRGSVRTVAGRAASPPGLCHPAACLSATQRAMGQWHDAVSPAACSAPMPSLWCGDRGRVLTPFGSPPCVPPLWHDGAHTTTPFHAVRPERSPGRAAASFVAPGIDGLCPGFRRLGDGRVPKRLRFDRRTWQHGNNHSLPRSSRKVVFMMPGGGSCRPVRPTGRIARPSPGPKRRRRLSGLSPRRGPSWRSSRRSRSQCGC
jgi:hypothetical protein